MYFGVDLGTLFTKTSDGQIFSSGVTLDFSGLSTHLLKISKDTYRMEQPASLSNYDVNLNKTRNSNIRLCYIYALVRNRSENNISYDTVKVLLPYSQWANDVTLARFKVLLDLSNGLDLSLNGRRIYLKVRDLKVAPEGLTAYELLNHSIIKSERTLLCDIGSRTFHQLLFDKDEFVDGQTETLGVLTTLQKLSNVVQTKAGLYIPPEDIPDSLTKTMDFYGLTDTTMLQIATPTLMEDFAVLKRKMETRWAFDSIKHFVFIGGGALLFKSVILKTFPEAIIPPDAQTIAAKGLAE